MEGVQPISPVRNSPDGIDDWKRAFARGAWTGLVVLAVILLSRRLDGAFENHMSTLGTLVITILATSVSLLANSLYHSAPTTGVSGRRRVAVGVLTLVTPAAMGIALLPPQSGDAMFGIGVLVFIAGFVMMQLGDHTTASTPTSHPLGVRSRMETARHESGRLRFTNPDVRRLHSRQLVDDDATPAVRRQGVPFETASPQAKDDRPHILVDDSLAQWMTRRRLETGADCIEGSIRIQFEAGQKTAAIHVPFSPAFSSLPDLNCEVGNAAIRAKVSTIYPYGARIELRRSADLDAEVRVAVGFCASALPAQPEAA